jgi:regulator of replication initiation timing
MEELDYILKNREELKSLRREIEDLKKIASNLQEKNKDLELENEDLKYQISQYKKELKVLDRKSTEAREAVVKRIEEDNRLISRGNKVTEAYNRMIDVLSDHSSWVHKYHVSRDDFREFYDLLVEASKITYDE